MLLRLWEQSLFTITENIKEHINSLAHSCIFETSSTFSKVWIWSAFLSSCGCSVVCVTANTVVVFGVYCGTDEQAWHTQWEQFYFRSVYMITGVLGFFFLNVSKESEFHIRIRKRRDATAELWSSLIYNSFLHPLGSSFCDALIFSESHLCTSLRHKLTIRVFPCPGLTSGCWPLVSWVSQNGRQTYKPPIRPSDANRGHFLNESFSSYCATRREEIDRKLRSRCSDRITVCIWQEPSSQLLFEMKAQFSEAS